MGIASAVVRHGHGHRHNLFFAGLYFLSGLKSLGDGLGIADFHERAALFPPDLFWQLLGVFCALAMMPLLLLFTFSFPRPMEWVARHPGRTGLLFVPSTIVGVAVFAFALGLIGPAGFAWWASAFNVLFIAVTILVIVLLLRTRARSPDGVERSQALYVLIGFLPGFATGWVISLLQLGSSAAVLDAAQAASTVSLIVHFVSPLLELLACSVVAFAILKYNLLGVDPKFRLGIKSVVAGFIFILIFLFTQVIENVVLQGQVFSFAGPYGSFILSGVFGMVLFKPIERVSGNVSERLMPKAQAQPGSLHAEQIYHAQASYVLRDAKVTDRELAFLRNLQTQLGLGDAAARRIEEEVEGLLKVDDPRTGHFSATPSPSPATAVVRAPPAARPANPPAPRVPAARSAAAPLPARPTVPSPRPAAPAKPAPAAAPAKRAAASKPAKPKAFPGGAAKRGSARPKPPARRGAT
jgi:hypothetical protein